VPTQYVQRPSADGWPPRPAPASKALLAAICFLALLGLGLLARTSLVTRLDLRVDVKAEGLRSPLETVAALGVTDAAAEAVGICTLLVAVIALVLRRRRWDAARLFVAAGAAWALGIAMKLLIARGRPPASLWLLKPDSSGSFPSGHDTTACLMIVIALVVFRGLPIARVIATALAVVFAMVVGASRIYLGDHYPTDVLGSWFAVAAAVLFVWAVADLPPIRRLGSRVLKDPLPSAVPA
jgi:membrane-associated phospholipid phosphatase